MIAIDVVINLIKIAWLLRLDEKNMSQKPLCLTTEAS